MIMIWRFKFYVKKQKQKKYVFYIYFPPDNIIRVKMVKSNEYSWITGFRPCGFVRMIAWLTHFLYHRIGSTALVWSTKTCITISTKYVYNVTYNRYARLSYIYFKPRYRYFLNINNSTDHVQYTFPASTIVFDIK